MNFLMIGIGDGCSYIQVLILSAWLETKKILRLLIIGQIVGCLFYLSIYNYFPVLIPVTIILIRLNIASLAYFLYLCNSYFFPITLRGTVLGLSNFIARPFAGVSTVLAEYTSNSPLIILFAAIVSGLSTFFINTPSKDNKE